MQQNRTDHVTKGEDKLVSRRLVPLDLSKLIEGGSLVDSAMALVIGSLGLFINLMYFSFEYFQKTNILTKTMAEPVEHSLVVATIPLYMAIGLIYLYLKRELSERKIIEMELKRHKDHLEELVKERTLELEGAYKELKGLDLMKNNIISNVSHELRTPLAVAMGAIEIASGDNEDLKNHRFHKIALKALTHQNLIVDDLLEACHLDMESHQLAKAPVDIPYTISQVISKYEGFIDPQLVVKAHVDGDLPRINADYKKLSHALGNLLSNAIKFTEPGGQIIIGAKDMGGAINIWVSDTGIGVGKEHRSRIFQSFYQADASNTRRYGGAGMGLAVAKKIMDAHGGNIWVEENPGGGSVFHLSLPKVD